MSAAMHRRKANFLRTDDGAAAAEGRLLRRKALHQIAHRATGRAVLAELRGRPSYSVYVFPFEFLPFIDWNGRDALELPRRFKFRNP
jgi:hypothetical protein